MLNNRAEKAESAYPANRLSKPKARTGRPVSSCLLHSREPREPTNYVFVFVFLSSEKILRSQNDRLQRGVSCHTYHKIVVDSVAFSKVSDLVVFVNTRNGGGTGRKGNGPYLQGLLLLVGTVPLQTSRQRSSVATSLSRPDRCGYRKNSK